MGCSHDSTNSKIQKRSNENLENPIKIILGPIIGKVDSNSARVLVEFSGFVNCAKLTATLTSHDNKIFSSTLIVEPNVAAVFKFNSLIPETKYKFNVLKISEQIESSFTTLAVNLSSKSFKIAILGCDNVIYNNLLGENSLYYDLSTRVKNNEINLLIHNGDQIYIDHNEKNENKDKPNKPLHLNTFNNCLDLIRDKPQKDWINFKDAIVNNMKDLYRRTWSGKVAECLANCPNLMIYDDHEFFNDFGYVKTGFDNENSPERFVTLCARRCYYEYQRQLREDIDFLNFKNITEDYFAVNLNGIGFFFIDHRGIRTWYKNPDDSSYLGIPQTNNLKKCLSEDFSNCSVIFLLNSNPFVIYSKNVVNDPDADKVKELFMKNDPRGFQEFLDLLYDYKKIKNQEIYLLSGDIHIGGHTEIYRNGQACFRQIISSGIGQKTKKSLAPLLEKIIGQVDTRLTEEYTFKHHDWTLNRNYATMEVKIVNEIPMIDSYLTISDKDIKATKQAVISNSKYSLDENFSLGRFHNI